jgi:hypothetical protein
MRSIASVALLALPLASLLAPAPLEAGGRRHRGVSIDSDGRIASCADLRIRFGGRTTERSEETFRAPAGPLTLAGGGNGGVVVEGWDKPDYEVTACKAAPDAEALAALFLIVKAPSGAQLSMNATNGPVSVRSLTGDLKVRSVNGPLTLTNVDGNVEASVTNGPVTVREGSGSYRVDAVNGPLSLSLSGGSWRGSGFVAETVNGPVSLRVPESFSSAISVKTSSWVPVTCRIAACPDTRRDRDDEDGPRTIEIGSGTPVIRITNQNGPLSVRPAKASEEED